MIVVRTGRDADLPQSNAARVRWSGGERTLKGGQEFSTDAKRVYVVRLSKRARVTIENASDQPRATELSVPGEPMLDDVLKPGRSVSLPAFASIELRR